MNPVAMDASAKIVFAHLIPSVATRYGTRPVHRNVQKTVMDAMGPVREEVQGSKTAVHPWRQPAAMDAHAKAVSAIWTHIAAIPNGMTFVSPFARTIVVSAGMAVALGRQMVAPRPTDRGAEAAPAKIAYVLLTVSAVTMHGMTSV